MSLNYNTKVLYDIYPNRGGNLFDITLEEAGYEKCEEFTYSCVGGKIELRPVGSKLGVKIPLGKHFKTKEKKRCWYVNSVTLEEIRKKSFLLDIKQVEKCTLESIIESQIDLTIEESVGQKQVDLKYEVEELKETIEDNYRPLKVYSHNIDETITYEAIKKLEEEGLKQVGTRHNSLFKLGKMYRYEGYNQEECLSALMNWMDNQDKTKYTTSWKECLKDIEQIVDYIYLNDVSLTILNKQITIYEQELVKIIKLPKPCQKLFAYALLVHSKRLSRADGTFYMTQKQISEATGYSERQVRRELDVLEEHGIFIYVSRNQMITNDKGQFVGKRPNKYKMNIIFEDNGEVDVKRYTFEIVDHKQYEASFNDSLLNIYDLTELKQMLPKRSYDELRRYKQTSHTA